MEEILALWKPILLSAVIVFVASSIIWMATPLHKHDYKNPGDKEQPLLDALKRLAMAPGVYYVPWCHGMDPKSPETQAKMKDNPWAVVTILPGAPNMGKMLGMWMLHLVLVGLFVAYLAAAADLPVGAKYLKVFQVTGTSAFLAHAGYTLPMSIWHAMPWKQVPGRLVDAVIYALLTAGCFAWLWPKQIASVVTP